MVLTFHVEMWSLNFLSLFVWYSDAIFFSNSLLAPSTHWSRQTMADEHLTYWLGAVQFKVGHS